MTITHDDATKILPEPGLFIGGERVTRSSGGTMERVDPTTGRVLGEFPVAGPKEVDAAVQAAHKAFPAWRRVTADRRREILWRVAELIRRDAEELKTLIALETGTPVGANKLDMAVDQFQYYAGFADKLAGEVIASYPAPAFDYVKIGRASCRERV